VGLAKTDELAPGQSQTLEVAVSLASLKSYDEGGKGTYIFEAGDYYLASVRMPMTPSTTSLLPRVHLAWMQRAMQGRP
jgi:hypothetical protein